MLMLGARVIYALTGFLKHFKHLRKIKYAQSVRSILEINPELLRLSGIEILVLDFDGVLASHGEFEPKLEVQNWLKQAVKFFGLGQIFILTNNPKVQREAFFNANFPEIEFVPGLRKKPYPDGLLKIQAKTKVSPEKILLVDDRLLTGMLACELAGVKGILIHQPYVNFSKRPLSELGFALIRWIEKWMLL